MLVHFSFITGINLGFEFIEDGVLFDLLIVRIAIISLGEEK